jgi:hypothetical protein
VVAFITGEQKKTTMALSNSTTRIFRTTYFDDYYAQSNTDPNLFRGEDFDFNRILFRPRYAVQSRELTQLQTILQAQIEQLGSANLKHGQPVYGCEMAINNGVRAGKVQTTDNVAAFFSRTLDAGQKIESVDVPTTTASVRGYVAIDEGYTDNYLVFTYGSDAAFNPNDVVSIIGGTESATFSSDSDAFSDASVFSVAGGVFFISGFLVRFKPATIVLDHQSSAPDAVVGLLVSEEILDELDDVVGETLLDPANQNAPGAHRFRLSLALASYGLTVEVPTNFIQLAKVVKGVIQYTQTVSERYVKWSELNDLLARRTYDEAGNYMIKSFSPVIGDDPDAEDHFRLAVGAGKAYVHGWEVNKTTPTNLSIRKGRTTQNVDSQSIALQVGNYVRVRWVGAAVPGTYFCNTIAVDLHTVPSQQIAGANDATYGLSKIGTAKLRMLEAEDIPALADYQANSIFKLFFFDAQFDTVTGNCTSGSMDSNGAVYAAIAFANGVANVGNALLGASIVLGGASSPVSGSFTVNSYALTNATHANVGLLEPLPAIPNGNTTYRVLYQTKDIDAFAAHDNTATINASSYLANNFAFQADIDWVTGKVGGSPYGATIVEGMSQNSLIYELSNQFVVANTLTTATSSFDSWVPTDENATMDPASGSPTANITLTFTLGAQYKLPTSAAMTAEEAQRYFVFYDVTDDVDGQGQIIEVSDTSGAVTSRWISNVAVVASGSDYNINFKYHHSSSMGGVRTFLGFARAAVTGLAIRTKTLNAGNTTSLFSDTTGAAVAGQVEYYSLNTAPGFAYSLFVPDVYQLVKVLYKESNTAFDTSDLTTATDVTDQFTLDTGQRDNSYEYGRAIVNNGASYVIHPTGRLLFIFDWFEPAGRGYATVDSYGDILYDGIPSYTSTVTGTTVSLRDVLDFRPERSYQNILAKANTVFAAGDDYGDPAYLTSTSVPYLIPASDGVWNGSYQFYLGRMDTVALCYDGTFTINEGQDAVHPVAPKDDSADLPLFLLTIPPYTLVDANGKPTGVGLTAYDYKRYTMNDVGKIEDRVAHLEYYTALNSLETITTNQPEEDAAGNPRYKNGILVDSFQGGDVGDVASPNFTASIDSANCELRTGFRSFALSFSPDFAHSTTANIAIIGDMATIAYTTTPFVVQNLATTAISVNPFDISTFYGSISLSPAVDTWKDTEQLPAQVIDGGGPTQAWIDANMPSYTVWGEWDQTWSGVNASTAPRTFSGFANVVATLLNIGGATTTFQDTQVAANFARQGTTFEYTVTTQNESQGNKVVGTSIVHSVRARDLVFSGSGLKPDTNLYLFFAGTNISNYVQQATVLQLESIVAPGGAAVSLTGAPFIVGQTVYVQKAITGLTATTSAQANVAGTGTYYQYELSPGQLVHVVRVNDSFDAFVNSITSNTAMSLVTSANASFANAYIYTRTPVTIAAVSPWYDGTGNVVYNISVVRAKRDTAVDQAVPYVPVPGSLSITKLVNDGANTTSGAVLLTLPNGIFGTNALAGWTITGSRCPSGVVRGWNPSSGQIRLDNDAGVVPLGTAIRIVGGPGAGQLTYAVGDSYSANQTVNVGSLTGVVAGESIYSIGPLASAGFGEITSTSPRAGTCAGAFHMQEAQFPTGTSQVRLTDSATNGVDGTTLADAQYEASGLTTIQQETIISTRVITQSEIGVTDTAGTIGGGGGGASGPGEPGWGGRAGLIYSDPLAETFLVDKTIYPQGLFLADLDLCFATVPDQDIPVTIEIRTTVNGYPNNQEVVPCISASGRASVTLRRDQVNTTQAPNFDDPTAYTKITFPSLVYLAPGYEYAIVIRSDSDHYYVWTAEIGALVVGSEDRKVSKQPYAGSFFKSQNASTWTESPLQDLMFRLNKAVWSGTSATPQQGKLVIRGVPPSTNTWFDSFEFYPHDANFADVTACAYLLDIQVMDLTSNTSNGTTLRYSGFPNSWQETGARSFLQGYGPTTTQQIPSWSNNVLGTANTIDGQAFLNTWSADVAPYLDLQKMGVVCIQHHIDDLGIEQDSVNLIAPGAGYLATLQTGTVNTVTGLANVYGTTTTFDTKLNVGDTVIVGGNVEVIVQSVENAVHFTATVAVGATRTANAWFTYGTVDLANNTLALTIAGGNGTGAVAHAVVGRDGVVNTVVVDTAGYGYSETPTFTIAAPTTPGGFDGSLQFSAGITYSSEVGNDNSVETTRYITRPVTLADGFEARDLKVYFDAYRPDTADFYVYYKVLPVSAAADARFDDQPWRLMTMVTANTVVSATWTSYREYEFVTPTGQALASSDDTTNQFKVFAIKVVMASSNTPDAPRVSNFRAIAFDA